LCDVNEIERAVVAFAPAPIGRLIVTASRLSDANRDLFAKLAAQHKLPAVYYERSFVAAGGLISYGPDSVDQFRRRPYPKGEKSADLPV
jgi:putative ABC transport system substrate-binding protein